MGKKLIVLAAGFTLVVLAAFISALFQPSWHNVANIDTDKISVFLIAAGDIADCSAVGPEKTAALLDRLDGTIAAIGDTVYPSGSHEEYSSCYSNTWGRYKARTMPAVGNHEYNTRGAAGYFSYFGPAAADPLKGYYSYNLGRWHVVVLNSNCDKAGGCSDDSAQGKWLKEDLAMNPSACTLAYMHHPPVSSEAGKAPAEVLPLWGQLYAGGVDVVLAGHQHSYERFKPLDAQGNYSENGIQLMIVGTGGAALRSIGKSPATSVVRNSTDWGVLKLQLDAAGYNWEFVPEDGGTFTDSGKGICR
ncbi:MAG TPA: alkaline phosphatase [Candidatus Diapherotrites archaeon]|uniref:Alkaline phosphatase n=1 Tax=Candidatus Iainarchaeum sp. TaxID=3101447 RepID=A0A7J4J465_9ARCH|nr:alkaline phosphatase [Candidatus Diapherotrites archaeon]